MKNRSIIVGGRGGKWVVDVNGSRAEFYNRSDAFSFALFVMTGDIVHPDKIDK